MGALENRFNILSSYKLVSNQSHERYSFYLQHSSEKLSKNHFFGPKLGQTDSKPNYMDSGCQGNSLEHPKVSKSSSDKKFGFSTIFPRYVAFLQINPIIFVRLIRNQIIWTQDVKPVL